MQRIGILGGTGFVGRNLVGELTRRGIETRVFSRRRERHRALLVFPTCELVDLDVHCSEALARGLEGCDAAINLVGILHGRPRRGESFHEVHVELAVKVAEACRGAGVERLLHMSALAANPGGPSEYLKTKGEGELRVHRLAAEDLKVASFRPSVIFGPGDDFFNRFATLLAISPFVLPLACPRSRFAPVFVDDVVRAFVRCLEDDETAGHRYELCGPREYSLRELVEYTADIAELNRVVLGLGDGLSRAQARGLELLPGPPFSYDNYLSLQVDSVSGGKPGLEALGIAPTTLETVVPGYLGNRNRAGRNRRYRRAAGRSEA